MRNYKNSDIGLNKAIVGSRCLELQKLLIAKGYDCGGYGADGSFGQGTYDSLIQFQKDNGLVSDGLAGEKTFAKLKETVTYVTQSDDNNWIAKLQSDKLDYNNINITKIIRCVYHSSYDVRK